MLLERHESLDRLSSSCLLHLNIWRSVFGNRKKKNKEQGTRLRTMTRTRNQVLKMVIIDQLYSAAS